MRQAIGFLVVALVVTVIVSPASAAGYQTFPGGAFYSCVNNPTAPVWTASSSESGGDPIRLRYGWGAAHENQLDKFLSVQNGRISVTDSLGNPVYSEQWSTGDTTGWSAYATTPLYTAGGQFVGDGVNTIKFSYISGLTSFPAGPTGDAIYYLSVDLEITKGVTDGIGATPPGPWVKFSNCPFAVHNYS